MDNYRKENDKVRGKNKKKTIEEIKNEVKEHKYELLSTEYINCVTKIKLKCQHGHEFEMRWTDFQQGNRCPNCAGNKRKTIKEVKEHVEKQDYELLSKKYINSNTKLKFRCPEKHEFEMVWSSVKNGIKCPICAYINLCGPNHPNWLGGISKDPYCELWNFKEFKELIKTRDNYKCMNPCCSGRGNRLDIHHINYSKTDCDFKNLICLCNSCNASANFDRE